jgi:hypothetical protein
MQGLLRTILKLQLQKIAAMVNAQLRWLVAYCPPGSERPGPPFNRFPKSSPYYLNLAV